MIGRELSASITSARNRSSNGSHSSTSPWCGASRATSRARSATSARSSGKPSGSVPLSESSPSSVAHSLRCSRRGFISAASTGCRPQIFTAVLLVRPDPRPPCIRPARPRILFLSLTMISSITRDNRGCCCGLVPARPIDRQAVLRQRGASRLDGPLRGGPISRAKPRIPAPVWTGGRVVKGSRL